MEERVIERPDHFEVARPDSFHELLEPFAFFSNNRPQDAVLIFLNTTLDSIPVQRLWNSTTLRICADGGANRLYYYFGTDAEREQFIPDFIVGDLDSLREEVRQYYVKRGTVVLPQYTQYATDFMKAIEVALVAHTRGKGVLYKPMDEDDGLSGFVKKFDERPPFTAFVAGGIGGRFDQTFHSINQLYATKEEFPNVTIYFVSETDVVFLAPVGKSYIAYNSKKEFNYNDPVPKLGLLPFGQPVTLSTYGLKYDVQNWVSLVGGKVSTSNGVSGNTGFTIDTTGDIVVSIEYSYKGSQI